MKTYLCRYCGKEAKWGYSKTNQFCSNQCQNDYMFEGTTLLLFQEGKISERRTLRRCLSHMHGYACAVCHISEYNSLPLTLQVDHVDSDPSNNQPSNLRLLCPNCHSQTPSFGGGNKGKGRKSRGISLR